jgi:hypothetical protein
VNGGICVPGVAVDLIGIPPECMIGLRIRRKDHGDVENHTGNDADPGQDLIEPTRPECGIVMVSNGDPVDGCADSSFRAIGHLPYP